MCFLSTLNPELPPAHCLLCIQISSGTLGFMSLPSQLTQWAKLFFFPRRPWDTSSQRQAESSDSSSLCCWWRKAWTISCGWIFTKRRCEVFPSAPGVCSSRVNREEAAVWPWRDSNWESWAPNRLLFFSLALWFIIYPESSLHHIQTDGSFCSSNNQTPFTFLTI